MQTEDITAQFVTLTGEVLWDMNSASDGTRIFYILALIKTYGSMLQEDPPAIFTDQYI
jgi:hypothetical protein